MQHPTSKQVQTVIDNLKKVLPLATHKNHLDMMQPNVKSHTHTCGTIHCHAGWYAVATLSMRCHVKYTDGCMQMAKDLGFMDDWQLEHWASENPSIWGNFSGKSMFLSENAFHSEARPYGAVTLQHIIDHWEEVRDRIVLLENSKTNN